jgi:micrococcal nuclease
MRSLLLILVGAALAAAGFLAFGTDIRTPPTQQTASVEEAAPLERAPAATVQEKTYRVLKVVDGDTVAIEMDGKSVTVRLVGLNTPETVDPRTGVQCFGTEASNKAKMLLTGTHVSIEQDASQDTFDRYGRLLAYVYLSDGTLFNEHMIAEGYGHEYTYNVPYKYQTQFKAAEKAARENKKGLWADDACKSAATKPAAVPTIPASGTYDCSRNVYNCTSFKTQADAQAAFASCGGSASDVHKLDSDKDGSVCESLP